MGSSTSSEVPRFHFERVDVQVRDVNIPFLLRLSPSAEAASSRLATMRRCPSMAASTSGLSRGGAAWSFRRGRLVGQRGRKTETTPAHRKPPRSKSEVRRLSRATIQLAGAGGRCDRKGLGPRDLATRQRVVAAFGSPAKTFSPAVRQRRSSRGVTLLSPAHSCKRRDAVREILMASPITAAIPA
jgi:hypothetical protein